MNELCRECHGRCCETVLLTLPPEEVDFLVGTRGGTRLMPQVVLLECACTHLTADGACGIYESRPQACRDYEVDGAACKLTRGVGLDAD